MNETENKVAEILLPVGHLSDAPVGITVYNGPSFIVEFINNKALETWGKYLEDVKGKPWHEIFRDSNAIELNLLSTAFRKGERLKKYNIKQTFFRNGTWQTGGYNYTIEPLKDKKNRVTGVLAMFNETTENPAIETNSEGTKRQLTDTAGERNSVLNEMEKGQEELQYFVKHAPVGIVIYKGPTFIVELANDQALEIWGKKIDEVKGRAVQDIFPEINAQERIQTLFDASVEKFKKGERLIVSEAQLTFQRKGQLHTGWYSYTHEPIIDAGGNVIGIIAVANEVTDQVLARKKIEESETALIQLANAMPQLVWMAESSGKIIFHSDRLSEYARSAKSSDDEFEWREILHPDDLDETALAWNNAVSQATTYEKEHRILMKDGIYRWHLSRALPQRNESGKIVRWYGTTTDIHELKSTQEKIREESKRLQLITDAMPSLISYINANEEYQFNNKAYEKWFGHSADEVKGKTIKEVVGENAYNRISPHIKNVLSGKIDTYETWAPYKEGGNRYIAATYIPHFNEKNEVIGFYALVNDLTERKHSEEALAQSEEKFRLLSETLPQMVWMRNVDGQIEFASKAWEEYAGIKNISEAWKAMVHPEDWNFVMSSWERDLNAGVNFRYEVRLKNKLGEYRWHYATGMPVKDQTGKIVKWIGFLSDIHVQKTFADKLAHEVDERTAELKKSKEHFSLLFNISPVAKSLSTVDDGTVIEVNPAWEKMFDKNRADVIGKNSIQLGMVNPAERQEKVKLIEEKGGTVYGAEMKYVLGNGKIIYAFISAVTIILDGVKCYLTAYFDITERKAAEDKLKETAELLARKNADLEKMNKELESFNYIASHDLQEPLRKIRTFIGRIQHLNPQRESLENYLKKINASAIRMSDLIQSVLDYSQSSNSNEKFSDTDLNVVLTNVIADFELRIKEREATIESTRLPVVQARAFQMNQLFLNLVSNSLKFCVEKPVIKISHRIVSGNELATQHARIDRDQEFLEITFSDNGIGFEPQYQDQIFNLFQRLHGKHEYGGGTGIGLSIVKKIVEQHNGYLRAESQPGKGTRFIIWIPYTQ